jgi:WD40 repeat protein
MNLSLIDPFVLLQDYPENTTASLRSGHSTCLRFNRKGDFLASGRADGLVVIFDVETNGVARKLKGHIKQVQSLCWSRDGRYLLTGSQDWTCNLWDLQDGSILRRVMFRAPVYMAELHPWNQCVVSKLKNNEANLFIALNSLSLYLMTTLSLSMPPNLAQSNTSSPRSPREQGQTTKMSP